MVRFKASSDEGLRLEAAKRGEATTVFFIHLRIYMIVHVFPAPLWWLS